VEATRKRRCGCYSAKLRLAAKHEAGFTLIELLVVMAIIAILAGLLTPALISAMRKAHEAATQNTIHQVDLAAHGFFNDKGDYPPSRWVDLNKIFKADLVLPAGYGPEDDAVFAAFNYSAPNQPNRFNEGIEVLTACLASRTGGPYLEPSAKLVRNTDGVDASGNVVGDTDTTSPPSAYADAVRACTNWYFGSNDIFEIADWWRNPLVYFHNRDYAACDGYDATGNPLTPQAYDNSPNGPATEEGIYYADVDGNRVPSYARSVIVLPDGTVLGYPNLNSFQLYSWGYGGPPDINPLKPRLWPGWNKQQTGAITNWEE
jgi:prepilin-type N-terminal cleavage/methylation domain-containing protein